MSTVYLIPDDFAYDAIGFDTTMTESHEESSTVTENPIEDGSNVIDHIIHGPISFSFEAIVCERGIFPNFYGDATYAPISVQVPIFQNFGVIIPSSERVTVLQWREGSRVLEMQDRLTKLRLDGITCTVITMTREYSNMLITNVSLPRQPLEKGMGRFLVNMRELVTVSTATVPAPVPLEPRGQPPVNKGAQAQKGWLDSLFQSDESLALKGATATGGPSFLQ